MEFTRKKRYLFSLLSGVLMVISFPYTGSLTPLVFISWVPLLLVEQNVSTKKYRSSKVFIHSFITFILYNLGTTWFIWNASAGGAVFAIGLNGLIMAFVFYLFHLFRKKFQSKFSYLILLLTWISFEYIHLNWDLSWPWLNLGNVFSVAPSVVQWYSITGIEGGSLWILVVNVLVFFLIPKLNYKAEGWMFPKKEIRIFSIVLLLPIFFSLFSYFSYSEEKNPVEVVVLQPNIDPYNEKFNSDLNTQLNKLFTLADENVTPNTQFVIAPETSLSSTFFEEELKVLPFYPYIIERKANWHNASLYIGASTLRFFETKNSNVSRKIEGGPGYIESYNSSLLIDENNATEIVHKSKLVLGVEKLPFSTIFPQLEELAINLDGASGSLGIEKEARVLHANNVTFAPSVCYESIYGDFISGQVKKGAELIFIITNDGWWGDTPGYRQHASFARLRAIENRRSIARSANTGISCVINQRGDVLQKTTWWVPAAINAELNKNNELTFYSLHGDWLGKLFLYLQIGFLAFLVTRRFQSFVSKSKS
jgi:apolipoprotein N-acyltransferase